MQIKLMKRKCLINQLTLKCDRRKGCVDDGDGKTRLLKCHSSLCHFWVWSETFGSSAWSRGLVPTRGRWFFQNNHNQVMSIVKKIKHLYYIGMYQPWCFWSNRCVIWIDILYYFMFYDTCFVTAVDVTSSIEVYALYVESWVIEKKKNYLWL